MKCCLMHYLKGARAYRRRIRELKEQVELLEDSAAAERSQRITDRALSDRWQSSARKWRGQAEDAADIILAAKKTADELRDEITRLQKRIAELEERDREEKGGAS